MTDTIVQKGIMGGVRCIHLPDKIKLTPKPLYTPPPLTCVYTTLKGPAKTFKGKGGSSKKIPTS